MQQKVSEDRVIQMFLQTKETSFHIIRSNRNKSLDFGYSFPKKGVSDIQVKFSNNPGINKKKKQRQSTQHHWLAINCLIFCSPEK